MEKESMHLGAHAQIFARAQDLRKTETEAEKMLWSRISKKQLGVKFRRQHPVLSYVLDFYCHELKLGIELDGAHHEDPEQQFHDKNRTNSLMEFGLTLIRFKNVDVYSDIEMVVETIKVEIAKLNSKLSPFRVKGRE